jgi:hypothetical protein
MTDRPPQITEIERLLDHLADRIHRMPSEAQLQADLDALKTAVTSYVTTSQATIAALQAQLAGTTTPPATQAQLDALDAETQTITALVTPAPPAGS